jgi:Peptidase A4 family
MKRVITGATGVALASASLAFARAPAHSALGPNIHPSTGVHAGSGIGYSVSYNWSGYAADPGTIGDTGTFTSVVGKWQVPEASCLGTPEENHAFWVGMDGFADSTVEQDGTFMLCNGVVATYWAWWEMYPTNDIVEVYQVFPGDFMSGSVAYANGKFKLTIADTTHKHSFTTTQKCGGGLVCARASAEWIGEDAGFGGSEGNLAEWTNKAGQQLLGFYAAFATETGGKKIAMGLTTGLWWVGMVNSSDAYYLAYPYAPGNQQQGFQDGWFAES